MMSANEAQAKLQESVEKLQAEEKRLKEELAAQVDAAKKSDEQRKKEADEE